MAQQTCTKCDASKPSTDFSANKKWCKSCVKVYNAEYRKRNLSIIKEATKVRRNENKDALSNRNKEYYEKNKDRIKSMVSEYQQVHPEKRKEWLTNNVDKRRKYNREYTRVRIRDPRVKLQMTARRNIRRALTYIKKGDLGISSKLELLGCDLEYFKEWIEDQFEDGMTWENHGEWHLDHVKPLASFDLTDPEQVEEASIFFNFQPLWAEDNLKKGAKII